MTPAKKFVYIYEAYNFGEIKRRYTPEEIKTKFAAYYRDFSKNRDSYPKMKDFLHTYSMLQIINWIP